ncbi:unnamed protein product [Ilex paraguariensis]|uniref:Pentatricopeptide repeat-containing protein n=1 Tax=Ilex paraguariensis TaxID=185542 RepID=A0ABC8SK76_9AQUA
MTHKHCYHLLSLLFRHHNRPAIQQIHTQLITTNLLSRLSTTTPILTIFNTLLRRYSLSHVPEEALLLFKHIQHQHQNQHQTISFDSFTYSFLIKACANVQRPRIGIQLHGLTIKAGFEFHVYVQTALVNMYADCGYLVQAQKMFDEMPDRNSVTWNVLITGFIKWGELGVAQYLFDVMLIKNVVSWTGLIVGYTRMNHYNGALALFRRMVVNEGIKPTEVTILAVFPAIWNLRRLESCQIIHSYGDKSGFNASDIRVMNSLIDAYAKCGSDISDERSNVVSWTSIISGFAMHGMGKEAADSFKRMENACMKPNRVTFLSVLNACSHGGLIDEGLEFFRKMVDKCGVVPDIKHYGCLIDMLGRAGRLDEAENMALDNPMEMLPGNIEVGERVMRKILGMQKDYGGEYVLLSNIFAGASSRHSDSESVRRAMDDQNAYKIPGLSLV